jgi:hypothetical protein
VAFESDLPNATDRSTILLEDHGDTSAEVDDSERKHNWNTIIQRLNEGEENEIRITMGSSGSAQVTRVRLLKKWSHLTARTEGPDLILGLERGV